MQRKVYILENLDCANCAAKIERKLSKLPELNDVSVTFATKQLRFEAEDGIPDIGIRLVGSEMCIRDSINTYDTYRFLESVSNTF